MTSRRPLLVLLATVLSAAGLTVATPAAVAQDREPVPVTVRTLTVESRGLAEVRTLTSPEPFWMAGLSWAGTAPEVMELRARQGDGWSDWVSVDPADGAAWGFIGSEPVWTGEARELQIRALRGGAPAQGVSAVLLDPGSSPFDLLPLPSRAAAHPVISRAGWGADESLRCSQAAYDDEVRAITLHHTAGGNDYRAEDSAAIVRSIYTYHARTLGWCDIGYHALVDKYGRVFEGRAGGLDRPVIGAHAGGFNRRTSSIAMMGNFSGFAPTGAQRDALVGWLDGKLALHGLDPFGETTLVSQGGGTSRHRAGVAVRLPVLFGHRDVGNTECPGDEGYALLPSLRQAAANTPA